MSARCPSTCRRAAPLPVPRRQPRLGAPLPLLRAAISPAAEPRRGPLGALGWLPLLSPPAAQCPTSSGCIWSLPLAPEERDPGVLMGGKRSTRRHGAHAAGPCTPPTTPCCSQLCSPTPTPSLWFWAPLPRGCCCVTSSPLQSPLLDSRGMRFLRVRSHQEPCAPISPCPACGIPAVGVQGWKTWVGILWGVLGTSSRAPLIS